ncbi:MAG: hypothetical protein QOH53_2266, partial [Ilumatobacteraceae bacterium]
AAGQRVDADRRYRCPTGQGRARHDAGTYNLTVTLVTPEVVTSGRDYSLRYASQGVGFPKDVGRAKVFYTTSG